MAKMILTNGYYAAEKGSWNWLTNGSSKFIDNKNIAFWFADLPALTNGEQMFYGCSKLISFSSDLPALTNGHSMFTDCTKLTSFSVDLPNLTNGYRMFRRCSNLTSFSSDLPALTDGTQMLYGCKLDLASVQNIANTINDLTVAGTTGTIYIGMSSTIQDTADLNTALEVIRTKGWTVQEQYN